MNSMSALDRFGRRFLRFSKRKSSVARASHYVVESLEGRLLLTVASSGQEYGGSISSSSPDTYTFTTTTTSTVVASVGDPGYGMEMEMDLIGPGNTLLDSVPASSGGQVITLEKSVPSGAYSIEVRSINTDTGSYNFSVATLPGTQTTAEYQAGGPITSGEESSGDLDGQLNSYSFSAAAGGTIEASVGDPGYNMTMEMDLFGPTGTLLQSPISPVAGQTFTLTQTVGTNPGTYYIVLRSANGGTGDYNFSVTLSSGPTLPAAPANVQASDGTYPNQVQITWDTVSGATSYQVWRNTVNNTGTATKLLGGITALTYDDTSALPGQLYYYWVNARNSAGIGPFSVPDTGYSATSLVAPTNVQAGAGTEADSVPITWNAVTGATSYQVWRSTFNDVSTAVQLIGGETGTSFDDTTAAAGPIYYYWVRARNTAGLSPYSASASGYIMAAANLAAPANVQASDGAFTGEVQVTWNPVAGAASYQVFSNTIDDTSTATKLTGALIGTSYDDTSAAPGQTYYYWVRARNPAGVGAYSAPDTGYAAVANLATVTDVQASDGTFAHHVQITWDAVTGATTYQIYRNTDDEVTTASKLIAVAGTSYSDTTAVAGQVYYYWIRARNGSGTGPYSAPASGYIPAGNPTSSPGTGDTVITVSTTPSDDGGNITFTYTSGSGTTSEYDINGDLIDNVINAVEELDDVESAIDEVTGAIPGWHVEASIDKTPDFTLVVTGTIDLAPGGSLDSVALDVKTSAEVSSEIEGYFGFDVLNVGAYASLDLDASFDTKVTYSAHSGAWSLGGTGDVSATLTGGLEATAGPFEGQVYLQGTLDAAVTAAPNGIVTVNPTLSGAVGADVTYDGPLSSLVPTPSVSESLGSISFQPWQFNISPLVQDVVDFIVPNTVI